MNAFNRGADGLVVTEATLAEWLAAGGSPLAGATLVPMEGPHEPAQPVTLNEAQNNGR